jgi:hypothetical protein
MAKFVTYFPNTGTCRVFDSYNLAEATYPRHPIIQEGGVLKAYSAFKKANPTNAQTINDWYELMFEWIDSTGKLQFVDGRSVKSPSGKLHLRPKYHDDDPAEVLAEAFWSLAMDCGNTVSALPASAQEKKGKRATGYSIDLVRANVVLAEIAAKSEKVPKQVKALIEVLTNEEFDFYTTAEMQKLCNSSRFYKAVDTTQDGWRIFRYYTPTLGRLGVIKP